MSVLPRTGISQPRTSTVSPRWLTRALTSTMKMSNGSASRSEAPTARPAPAATPASTVAVAAESSTSGLE